MITYVTVKKQEAAGLREPHCESRWRDTDRGTEAFGGMETKTRGQPAGASGTRTQSGLRDLRRTAMLSARGIQRASPSASLRACGESRLLEEK
ncbi:hypothetical protein AAFF_G00087200 [Aldrovandia affinis]|uniref:Uncharacterized protein n=1 Tax=Aldrovandia affinis TaxID=143900 RepID=A0AAD7RWH8_9TELE|nr:hypothetical protein AAFF_G00087200 [Aldrovandia affinis]